MIRTILMSVLFTLVGANSYAQTFVATFVMTKGDVKILRPAESNPKGPFLIYEGKKYSYENGRIGKKVMPQEILQTGTDGRAKIVYPNGDHFNLGPGTSLSLPSSSAEDAKPTQGLNLFYGRVRALISKGGPRTGMKTKTPSATAGVRGTDFFIRHNPTIGSQVSVLRGEVALKANTDKTNAKPTAVKKGFTGSVDTVKKNAKTVNSQPKVALATKEQIVEIQKETALKPDQKALDKLPTELKKQIDLLTVKSTEAVVEDIKTDDPSLYKELKEKMAKKEAIDIYDINTKVVAKLYNQAPGESKTKPTAEELDSIGKDVYDKYFKPAK